jgi:hypothetical protein
MVVGFHHGSQAEAGTLPALPVCRSTRYSVNGRGLSLAGVELECGGVIASASPMRVAPLRVLVLAPTFASADELAIHAQHTIFMPVLCLERSEVNATLSYFSPLLSTVVQDVIQAQCSLIRESAENAFSSVSIQDQFPKPALARPTYGGVLLWILSAVTPHVLRFYGTDALSVSLVPPLVCLTV